jgi:hypothetical protein
VVKGRTRDIAISCYEESNLTHEVSSHLFLDSVALANAADRSGKLQRQTENKSPCSIQRDALSDQRNPYLHPLVGRLSAELPAPQGHSGRAQRIGRPFVDQPLGGSFPAAYREDGAETQAPDRRQLAHR